MIDYDPQGSKYDSSAPAYDHRWEYAVEAELEDGALILQHKAQALLELVNEACTVGDYADALAELLAPLFSSKTPAMTDFRKSLLDDDREAMFQIAFDAIRCEKGD